MKKMVTYMILQWQHTWNYICKLTTTELQRRKELQHKLQHKWYYICN